MTRYMVRHLRADGTPRAGTLYSTVRRYQNDANARRYLALILRGDHFPAGQYVITTFPPAGSNEHERHVGYLYKTVTR